MSPRDHVTVTVTQPPLLTRVTLTSDPERNITIRIPLFPSIDGHLRLNLNVDARWTVSCRALARIDIDIVVCRKGRTCGARCAREDERCIGIFSRWWSSSWKWKWRADRRRETPSRRDDHYRTVPYDTAEPRERYGLLSSLQYFLSMTTRRGAMLRFASRPGVPGDDDDDGDGGRRSLVSRLSWRLFFLLRDRANHREGV